MRIRPTCSELLATAQVVLREEVLPCIPPEERPTIDSIESAMVLAAHKFERELPPEREDVAILETARAALRGKVLGLLPKARQYDARLVAKAIAIAANELANGNVPERDELERLAALLHEKLQPADTAHDVRKQLTLLYARLSAGIRHGRADPGTPGYAATRAHLIEITRQALLESNPAFLESHQKSARAGKDAT
jgi:hypothetical protein